MIVIIDYGVGNLTSIQNMVLKGGAKAVISNERDIIANASKIILPGMGHFDNCMKKFNNSGFRELVTQKVLEEKIPTLGICVGLQMFMSSSEEGNEPGLGWIKGKTVRFDSGKMSSQMKIPNMGWLDVIFCKQTPVLEGLDQARFYFAHTYHVQVEQKAVELMSASYGYDFTAAVEQDNIIGVQFHPEKSHRFGLRLLKNFCLV